MLKIWCEKCLSVADSFGFYVICSRTKEHKDKSNCSSTIFTTVLRVVKSLQSRFGSKIRQYEREVFCTIFLLACCFGLAPIKEIQRRQFGIRLTRTLEKIFVKNALETKDGSGHYYHKTKRGQVREVNTIHCSPGSIINKNVINRNKQTRTQTTYAP